jgi:predicted Zn-dependent protease
MTTQCGSQVDKPLEAAIDEIKRREDVPNRLKSISMASVYVDYNCSDMAIHELEGLLKAGDEAPDIYFYLGEAYAAANKNVEASEKYAIAELKALMVLVAARAGQGKVEKDAGRASQLFEQNATTFKLLQERVVELDQELQNYPELRVILEELEQIVATGCQQFSLLGGRKCNCPPGVNNGWISLNGCNPNGCSPN